MDAGLIKLGVKCAAYFVDPDKKALVDLEGTALRDGVAAHRKIKRKLEEMKIPLVPLLLVQADSTEKSVERLKARLLRMGFTDEQVAIHTADEPDSGLLALANEPRREVLIFKMAVALGFDAPRAFTLVSMRASRDADFGVQLVGRILRVHRLLQGRAQARTLPPELTHGLVSLASAETQTGLDIAGQKINAIQTEYAKASTATVVLRFGESLKGVGSVDKRGQIELFGLERQETGGGRGLDANDDESEDPEFDPPTSFDFGEFFGSGSTLGSGNSSDQPPKKTAGPTDFQRYPLRSGMPRCFKTQVVSALIDVTEEDCANRFMISTRELFEVMKNRIPVEKRTLDVFTHEMQQEFNFAADLSSSQAAQAAEKALLKNKVFDPRELRKALLKKMEMVMREEAMEEADSSDKVAHFLDVILATHPELLWEAQKKALAESAEIIEAENLPDELMSADFLPKSPRNVYGVIPPQLNGWEKEFADILDRDPNNLVNWWHRNPPDKPWSVNVLMESGRGLYPDFVIGIEGRKNELGALLADPKDRFETSKEAPKVRAEHHVYGRVLIVAKDGARWMTVEFDEKAKKPVANREFRLSDTVGF